jgi:thioredoxin reductase
MTTTWECIVVGGGAAGLSGALVLGRARRRTLVVDAGEQSNRLADGIGGLLGHDGRPPADLYASGRAELAKYDSVEIRESTAVAGEAEGDGFVLELADGSRERARRVLLATGMEYRPPGLPGVAERWGGSVFHCPFCHGWEHRDERLGVLDSGASGTHRALLLRLWSDDVTLLTDGPAGLEPDEAERLSSAGVAVDEREAAGLEGPDGTLTAVLFANGERLPLGGLLVPAPMRQRSALAEQLGVATGETNPIVVDPIEVDSMFRTRVPGLFAVGDLTGHMPSVARAIAAGHSAAAAIVQELVAGSHPVTPTGRA